jgi:hypothetical protein
MEFNIYWGIAIVSTVVFSIKLILLVTIGDGADMDIDVGIDDDMGGSDSFELLSIQSIMSFLMIFSWSVLAFRTDFQMNRLPAISLASALAFIGSYLFSLALYKFKNLSSGEVEPFELPEGTVAEVYSNIPKKDKGYGEIKVNYQGKTHYLKAYSADVEYKTKSIVKVTKSHPLTIKENI